MSYLIYADLISSLFDPKLVDPGSKLVHTALCVRHQVYGFKKLNSTLASSASEKIAPSIFFIF